MSTDSIEPTGTRKRIPSVRVLAGVGLIALLAALVAIGVSTQPRRNALAKLRAINADYAIHNRGSFALLIGLPPFALWNPPSAPWPWLNDGIRSCLLFMHRTFDAVETVDFRSANLDQEDLPALLRALPEIQYLYVTASDANFAAIGELHELLFLEIESDDATDAGMEKLSRLPHLTYFSLRISDRQIKAHCFEGWQCAERLEMLELWTGGFTRDDIGTINRQFKKLKHLDVTLSDDNAE